jgi:hypothetical protein
LHELIFNEHFGLFTPNKENVPFRRVYKKHLSLSS